MGGIELPQGKKADRSRPALEISQMPINRAVYDTATQTYVERPFDFDPLPLQPGWQLDNDIATYLDCAERVGVMPSSLALIFMGDGPEQLFLHRAATRESWLAFLAEVVRRYPLLAARNAEKIARVVALATGSRSGTMMIWRPTTVEVSLGVALIEGVPAGVTIVADAALPGGRGAGGHVRRCDYHLFSGAWELRLEAAGLINSTGRPPTIDGVIYAEKRLPARDAVYALLGLPPPITLHADELLDRARLLPIVAELAGRVA